ncbi:hypothetical protein IU397_04080 [Actibacterium sp. 188UL27-1]|nr:hypothetical protein [Actibacterium sp. 188UL27-1]
MIWTLNEWFYSAYLTDTGLMIVGPSGAQLVPQGSGSDQVMFRVFRNGAKIASYTLGDLIRDPDSLTRTVSHRIWGQTRGFTRRGHLRIRTAEGRNFIIHRKTGSLRRR